MMQDSSLKELLIKHFWAQRAFVQPEVNVYYGEGVSGPQKLITDIDVFALVPCRELTYSKVLGDCRTLKSQSPATRALWLRGLLDFVGGDSGMILLKTGNRIERDHKLAASSVHIQLMNTDDFAVYDRAIIYPEGSAKQDISIDEFRRLLMLHKNYPSITPLSDYLYRDFWQEQTFGQRIRHTLAAVRKVARELDPTKAEHLAMVCEAAAAFAVGVAECSATVFQQYLQPAAKEELSGALKILVWGGVEQYQFYQTVRDKLLKAKGSSEEADLELPHWPEFLQLIRNVLENPSVAFQIPWLLRSMAMDLLRGTSDLGHTGPDDLLLLKFGMLSLDYTCHATYLPADFGRALQAPLVRRQADLALSRTKPAVIQPEGKKNDLAPETTDRDAG